MIAWKRANLELCTIPMLDVLKHLRSFHDEYGYLYCSLNDVHGRTIRSLVQRDWIVQGDMKNGSGRQYKITGRGVKACKIYEIPPEEYDNRRWDGICSRCGQEERSTYSTGNLKPYCDSCMKKMNKRKYALQGYQKKEGICPMCKKRSKHVMPSGEVRSYCKQCRRKRAKKYRQAKYKRELAQVKAGETLLCYRCHKQPRYVTANTVQDYCEHCTRQYRIERQKTK